MMRACIMRITHSRGLLRAHPASGSLGWWHPSGGPPPRRGRDAGLPTPAHHAQPCAPVTHAHTNTPHPGARPALTQHLSKMHHAKHGALERQKGSGNPRIESKIQCRLGHEPDRVWLSSGREARCGAMTQPDRVWLPWRGLLLWLYPDCVWVTAAATQPDIVWLPHPAQLRLCCCPRPDCVWTTRALARARLFRVCVRGRGGGGQKLAAPLPRRVAFWTTNRL